MSYLEKFKALAASGKCQLYGDNLLVERVSEEDTKEVTDSTGAKISLYVSAASTDIRSQHEAQRAVICRVLLAGQGFYDPETKETTALELQPGALIEVPAVSVSRRTTFCGLVFSDKSLVGYVAMGSVIAAYQDDAAYQAAKEVLK